MVFAFLFFLPLFGFGREEVTLILHHHRFIVETARTVSEWTEGLMHRKTLPPDRGMIFIFPDSQVRYFWMKDTPIPLDVLFLDESGTIVSKREMEPDSTKLVSSDKPCDYAIELLGGTIKRFKIRAGERVERLPRRRLPEKSKRT